MNKQVVRIQGMHCRSCEILIEEKLKEIPEISKAEVNHKKGAAEIYYGSQKPNAREIETAIREAGYALGTTGEKPFFSRSSNDYRDLGIALLFLLGAILLLRIFPLGDFGIASFAPSISLSILIGVVAGFSTCMALVGGLVLGIAARHAEKHPDSTPLQKFRPHLFFNLGRILSYTVLGGLLGAIGSALQPSPFFVGILTLAIAGIMLLMGLKLLGIFPRLESVTITIPKSISTFFGLKSHTREYSHRNALIAGAFTFFLPCGFTQSMQIFAIGTGSIWQGATIMGLFALGTSAGLLGIGGVSAFVKGVFAKRFFSFSGLVVLIFSLINISNAATLLGWTSVTPTNTPLPSKTSVGTQKDSSKTSPSTNIQTIRMTEYAGGYRPNTLTVTAGIPVRWIITAETQYSCAASLIVPSLKIQKLLQKGENIIEFTPTEAGVIPFSCSMGMYTGKIIVTGDGESESTASQANNDDESSSVQAGICTNSGCSNRASKE